jgi:hypothetical protein
MTLIPVEDSAPFLGSRELKDENCTRLEAMGFDF